MPVPSGERIYFQYTVKEDKFGTVVNPSSSVVSDPSNVPYTNMIYSQINDVGKQWIKKLTLILTKETLGRVLSKYEGIPIPEGGGGGTIRLDGETLRSEASQEKEIIYEQLREMLEASGRSKQMEKMAANFDFEVKILSGVPPLLYIG